MEFLIVFLYSSYEILCSNIENDGDQKPSGKYFIFNLEKRY